MNLLLLKAARINYAAGEVVEVSPAQAAFLLSVGAAVAIETETKEIAAPKRETRKGTTKK